MNTLERSGRRAIATLFVGQSLHSAARILAFTIGAIVAVELAGGNSQWTGVPGTLGLVGAALIAYPVGWLMDRAGRRSGLSVGFALGVIGALIAGWAIIQGSLLIFLVGFFFFGASRGAVDLGRYAAAEATLPHQRGRAISLIVLAGTVGSIAGPSLIAFSNKLGTRANFPDLTGPWFVAGAILMVGLLVNHIFLRPDPREIARQLAADSPEPPPTDSTPSNSGRSFAEVLRDPRAVLAIGAMVLGQLVMVVVMTVTPVYMRGHQQALGAISLVISAHTLGMFGLSFLTGWLVDKVGRARMILAGGLILILACVMAPFSSDVPWLVLALFLLGLGWNFCFVAGSTLFDDILAVHEKGRLQGSADMLVKLASGAGSLTSGLAFAASGFALTSWVTIVFAAIPVVLALWLNVVEGGAPLGEAA